MSNLYPIYLKLAHKNCLVVGGGKIAERKSISLLKAKAKVTVISPELTSGLEELSEKSIHYIKRPFQPDDLNDMFLVIAATDDSTVNEKIYSLAEKKNMLVNVVDIPDLCNFYVPSIYQQGDLMIAISTQGQAPALSRLIRKQFEKWFPKGIADDIKQLARMRDKQKQTHPDDIETRGKLAKSQALKVLMKYFDDI